MNTFYNVIGVLKKLHYLIESTLQVAQSASCTYVKNVLKAEKNTKQQNMDKHQRIITILSYEDFTDMCAEAGGDEFAYREIIKAVVQINQIMEEILLEQQQIKG